MATASAKTVVDNLTLHFFSHFLSNKSVKVRKSIDVSKPRCTCRISLLQTSPVENFKISVKFILDVWLGFKILIDNVKKSRYHLSVKKVIVVFVLFKINRKFYNLASTQNVQVRVSRSSHLLQVW